MLIPTGDIGWTKMLAGLIRCASTDGIHHKADFAPSPPLATSAKDTKDTKLGETNDQILIFVSFVSLW